MLIRRHSSIVPWLSLVGVIWLQSFNGSNTDFPAYSSQLKNLLSISQIQLNNLAFASDAGKLFGWFSGVAAVFLPLWMVLTIGGILGLIGYGLQFLFVVHKISYLSYWHIFLLNILAGNSICWINTVCYMTIIRNFSFQYSQVAVGLSTSYVGLSAKVYTNIVDAISSSTSTSSSSSRSSGSVTSSRAELYLFLNSILPLMVSLITAPIFRDIMNKAEGTIIIKQEGFTVMFLITIVTGIYSVMGSLGLKKISLISPLIYAIFLGVLLLVIPLMVPVALSIREGLLKCWIKMLREKKVCSIDHDKVVAVYDDNQSRVVIEVKEQEAAAGSVVEEEEEEEEEEEDSYSTTSTSGTEIEIMRVREEIGVKEMVRRVDFWLYFFVYMFGATLGLVFMNNLGQIAESRGQAATSLVSLSSSFGSKYMLSTTASIVTLMAPIAGAFFLLVSTISTISLYIRTVIIGVCCGAFTSLTVSATTELFGVKNFSVNHNIIVANIPIGSFLFGTSAAVLYQRSSQGGASLNNGNCMGPECYRNTFLIWGSIATLGTLLAFILYTEEWYAQKHRITNKSRQ
ncbi:Nodulin-like [Macleaya cordata]|uniref:Nodulin-like n=1 Tax=Macleaya cordata TaxID=56857 RepID=A0A200R3E9_MACCD|nr:Nodulin-like [Macleaya cordata]